MGVTTAVFQFSGKEDVAMQWLIMHVMGLITRGRHILMSLIGIWSIPLAILLLILKIWKMTSYSVIGCRGGDVSVEGLDVAGGFGGMDAEW